MVKRIRQSLFIAIISVLPTVTGYAQDADAEMLKLLPEIPAAINEPIKRAEYLALHFWDKFNFKDTEALMKDHLLERCLVDYLDILSMVSDETTQQAANILLKKTEEEAPDLFQQVLNLTEKYLYEPTSPICNDEKLIPFLQYALKSSLLSDTEKIRPNFLLENIRKNRVGNVANDFTYTLMNDETGTLHALKADYILLYFNDPECDDCMMLTKQLTASPIVDNLIKKGALNILTVYVNDEVEAWKKHASDVPDTWIYSRDAALRINMEEIYNIKQFPTLYLLDKDKKVLLKDTTFETLEQHFI